MGFTYKKCGTGLIFLSITWHYKSEIEWDQLSLFQCVIVIEMFAVATTQELNVIV